jgi:hypothetical protein
MRMHASFYFFVICLITLLSSAQARISSGDSATSAAALSAWASSLMCSSAAVGPQQTCTPNIEDSGGFLDYRMLTNLRTSFALDVELIAVEAAKWLQSSWLQPLYARLRTVADSAASCDNSTVSGFFGTQLVDPFVSASFSTGNADACNVTSLDVALEHVAESYKGRSPARVSSYISVRSGSSRVHAAHVHQILPNFDARLLPLVSAAHGSRIFLFLVDGSFASDSNALRLLIQSSIRLIGGRDLVQMIWATPSGPALPLCRESLAPALATADLKRCLIQMSRDMKFSGVAQLTRSMSIAEEIVSAYDVGSTVEIILFATSSSSSFPFKDVYQGAGCIGRSSSSLLTCPYRSMFAVSGNSTVAHNPSLIIHSVILTPSTSTRFPEITCQSTGASVFIDSALCNSRFKCTSALSPIFMTVSRAFVEFGGSNPSWLPADERCSLTLHSGLPLSCGPSLSYSTYVSNSSDANIIAGISSAEVHPIEIYDVLRDSLSLVSFKIHGLTSSNVELLLVHVASGVVLGSSRLSTVSPKQDEQFIQGPYSESPSGPQENGFKSLLPCCTKSNCQCPSGQPNQITINDIAAMYQIPSSILNFRNVTCSSSKPGVVVCSILLDVNLALVVIAHGRRTLSPSQAVLSGEKMPSFADFPVAIIPAVSGIVDICQINMTLPQAAQLLGASPSCTHIFRSNSSVQLCRSSIGIHISPYSWHSSFLAMQGLDVSKSLHFKNFLAGLESSFFLPFSGLHSFAIVGSAISYGLMQTAVAPSNDVLSVFFGYRQGVFTSTPARAVPPAFDHTLTDWFLSCASIQYLVANSIDDSSFPVRFVILPLRQSFAAQSAQQLMPPVFVIARPAFYPQVVSQETDNDNFLGVFGVEVDIPSLRSALNQNEICRLDSSNCILANNQGWILLDKYLYDPLAAMSMLRQQHLSEPDYAKPNFQRPLSLHLSRQYSALSRELLAQGIARSSSVSVPLRGGLLKQTIDFQIHLPSLPAVFELVDEGLAVSVSRVPWSNAVLFILGSSSAMPPKDASSFGCGVDFFLDLDLLQPVDAFISRSAPVPQTMLRQASSGHPHPTQKAALALPWSSQWPSAISKFSKSSLNFSVDAAPRNFNETYFVGSAYFFAGTRDAFAVHLCDYSGLPLSIILAAVFAFFGAVMVLVLVLKHFQAVHRMFNITVQMSLEPRNLSYSL